MDALTYLQRHCRLRRNVLTGEVGYAYHDGDYAPLSREGRNTIILEALRQGVIMTEEDVNRFAHSTLVSLWNPAQDWLEGLDAWDGHDYAHDLSDRIITSNGDWPNRLHKWMLQMVARWTGREVAQRDQIVPVLVGQFGFGKTSFCNLILPPALRAYYTDVARVRQSADIRDLATTHLLVCMDEYYQDNPDQQLLSRYLFSRSTPQLRAPYGVTEEPRRNCAAFIATTGNLHPMTDAAGAAHLVCVEVGRAIDLGTPISYEQLYAQLRDELDDGADFALTDDEREAMAVQNSPFQETDSLTKMVSMLYAHPPKGKRARAVGIDSIIDRLMKEYPYWTPGEHVNQDVGYALQEAGFPRTRIHGRSVYRIVERDPRKLDFIDDAPQKSGDATLADNPLARALLSGLGGLLKDKG